MTLKDCYRLTLHTINENRYRSVLTVIISTFLSFLIMGMLCLAISFSKNGNDVIGQAYFNDNSIVTINYSNTKVTTPDKQQVFEESLYEPFLETIDKHKSVVDYIMLYPNIMTNMAFTDPNYPVNKGINIVEGRNIQKSEGRNEAIFNRRSFASDVYRVGQTYTMDGYYYTIKTGGGSYETFQIQLEFTMVGAFEYVGDREVVINGEEGMFNYDAVIGDIGIAFNLGIDDVYIRNFSIQNYTEKRNKNGINTINTMKKLTDDLNKTLPQAVTLKSYGPIGILVAYYNDPTVCTVYNVFAENNFMRFIVILVAIIFSIILLLMSVGSLANSVMISIDASKKFIGLLKALGMRGKSLKLIVVLESITLISVGVLIGYLLLFALYAPLTSIVTAIVNSIYGVYVEMTGFVTSMYIPVYVFFGTVVAFLLLTFLFSRGSLRKIVKMEPIVVINEVS